MLDSISSERGTAQSALEGDGLYRLLEDKYASYPSIHSPINVVELP